MKSVIGLDIGLKNIKLVNLALRGKNVELLKLEYIEATKPSNQYEIIDLVKFMFKNQGLKSNIPVCLSISADESFLKIISVTSKRARKLKKAVRNELKENVVFSLEDCIWDYSLVKYGPKEIANEILLVAAKKEAVLEKAQLIKKANCLAKLINLDILSTYNCLKFNTELIKGKLYALIDISSNKTQVFIFDEKESFWLRTLAIGGDRFTDLIAENLKISTKEAEEYKKNMLLEENIATELKELSNALMKEISAELDKAFNSYYFQTSESASKGSEHKIDEIFLTGGGSLYLGLDKFLSEDLGIPARYISPLNKIVTKDKKILSKNNILNMQIPQFATAIGLALQGLNSAGIKINLIKKIQGSLLKRINRGIIYNISIILLFVLLVFLWKQIYGLNMESIIMAQKSEELNAVSQESVPKLINLKSEYDKTNAQMVALSTLINNRDILSRVLHKMSEVITRGVWITDFDIKLNYNNNSGLLILNGKSINYSEINKLISGFKDSGLFKDIKLASSKMMIEATTEEELFNFTINLEVRWP